MAQSLPHPFARALRLALWAPRSALHPRAPSMQPRPARTGSWLPCRSDALCIARATCADVSLAPSLPSQETPVDPLEAFCATAPDADECRVYED